MISNAVLFLRQGGLAGRRWGRKRNDELNEIIEILQYLLTNKNEHHPKGLADRAETCQFIRE